MLIYTQRWFPDYMSAYGDAYCFWVITTGTIISNLRWQRNKRYRFGGTNVNGSDRDFNRVTVVRYHAAAVRVLYERIELLILIAGPVLLVFF